MDRPSWNNSLRSGDPKIAAPHKPRIIRKWMDEKRGWQWLCYRPADGFLSGVGICTSPTGAYVEWQYS